MQIHEITQPLNEGITDWAKGVVSPVVGAAQAIKQNPTGIFKRTGGQQIAAGARAAQAADSASKLAAKGYGAGYQGAPADWHGKLQAIANNQPSKQYIKSLVQAWQKQAPQALQKSSQATPASTPSSTPVAGAAVSSQAGSANATVNLAAQRATDKLKAMKARRQGLKEAVQNPDAYKKEFLNFIIQQLATRESVTGKQIGLADAEKFPDLKQKLDLMLDQIAANAGTNLEASSVEHYITHALAGVQAAAQAVRNTTAQRGVGTVATQQGKLGADVDQTATLAQLSAKLGGVDNLIKAAKKGAGLP